MIDHQQTLQHLSHVLGYLQSKDYKKQSPAEVSGMIKKFKTNSQVDKRSTQKNNVEFVRQIQQKQPSQHNYQIRNFQLESQKLQWIGISLGHHLTKHIQHALLSIATQNNVKQIRFWGKILGTQRDYYVIQGVKEPSKNHKQVSLGSEKSGEGVNYYNFWVSNDPFQNKWTLLPDITVEQLRTSRRIKKLFKGDLNAPVSTHPKFEGTEKQYLKAQLSRMTHSLQLCPNGIYKVHEENPKLIENDEEGKVPEFAQLNTLEGWKHKNQMILSLGRCSHFIDPSIPEEEIGAIQDKLMAQDPEIERLRGITQDKTPENSNFGTENVWIQKMEGDSQIFTKDQGSLVYGVTVLRNIYWPGWVTIGYKNGYSNFYLGNGLKITQPSWDEYTNPDLQVDGTDTKEYDEPNPKQESKPVQQAKQEQEQND